MLELRPLDTLFFRDGKSFTGGDDTWAETIFPPLPSVVYGAMRSCYMTYNGGLEKFLNGELADKIGTPVEPGGFGIKAVYLHNAEGLLLPVPLDMLKGTRKENGKDKEFLKTLRITNADNLLWFDNHLLGQRLAAFGMDAAESSNRDFLNGIDLYACLSLKNSEYVSFKNLGELVCDEPKIGIKRSRQSHSSEEGYLYRANMVRFKMEDLSVMVDFAGLDDFPEQGLLKLGGEAKTASFKKVDVAGAVMDYDSIKEIKNRIGQNKLFKIYFASPSIFKGGWLPEALDEKTMTWGFNGLKLQLLTAALGAPINIVGWDIQKKAPKPMYKAVPAGSVYYFRLSEGTPEQVIKVLHHQNISDYYAEQGFGFCLVGAVEWKK